MQQLGSSPKLSFEFDPSTLVARPIIHRPDTEEFELVEDFIEEFWSS